MKNRYSEVLHELAVSHDREGVFRTIEPSEQGFVLQACSKLVRRRILSELHTKEIVDMVHYLDPDNATDVLQDIDKKRRKQIVEHLDETARNKVEYLLKFDPRTAAGFMSLDYIQVHKGMTFDKVFKLVKKHEKRTGKSCAILAVESGLLIGEIPWRLLIGKRPTEKVDRYIKRLPTVRYDCQEEEVMRRFRSHPHNKIVVLDDDRSILGVIHSDDILRIIGKSGSGDLYDFAGVQEEESVLDPFFKKVKYRYKWLILNLFTGMLGATVVSMFQDTIEAFVLLAVYMPIVAGVGGNAATQTLAVTVRGLALKEIELKTGKKAILNELLAGGINGIIVGVLVGSFALIVNRSPTLGIALSMAMIINLMIAGFFGAIVPLIMKAFKKDPATSATIFITTATDVCGFFVFLGLASMMI